MECKDCCYYEFDGDLGCMQCHYPVNDPGSADIKDADDLFDCLDDCKPKRES